MSSKLFHAKEKGHFIQPSNVMAMMSGSANVFYIHPRYRINYVDGTFEEARIHDMSASDRADYFKMVGKIQEASRTANR